MRQATTDKEKTMLTLPIIWRIIDHLRKPCIQRLITLVVSALLAISLISTTIVLALPSSEHEVASSASSQFALPAHLLIQDIVSKMHAHGQGDAQATKQYDTERRLV